MGEEELFISCRNGDLDRVRYSTGIRTETEVTTNDRQPITLLLWFSASNCIAGSDVLLCVYLRDKNFVQYACTCHKYFGVEHDRTSVRDRPLCKLAVIC